ncbi:MAG: Asp-tRNA(Asn)/Glu-tRNA(Gln) amidotransferase subunit GatA [Bacteroidetes bacterium]|nr:Asp-tRNA(Asn)/Glu-tRNA(Gln) amidotransferase subunit GatA [Bacteroidota bacterium]MBU1717992.1 Asp-tRNA(Asn)/Glu-tRNA(Gln) amidotransferase subunit GatA [Bacteroidota bacterium]
MIEAATYSEIRDQLISGQLTCSLVTRSYLERILKYDNSRVFLEIFPEILDKAAEADKQIREGNIGKLTGMVIAIKDNISQKGRRVSASSSLDDGYEATDNATVIDRLLEEGALIIGRVSSDDFMFSNNGHSGELVTVSGTIEAVGAAAAVAQRYCMAAISTDSCGSIRLPASSCGVFGIKPTFGRVPRHGLISIVPSFDQIGPIARNNDDLLRILEVISGRDGDDIYSSGNQTPDFGNQRIFERKKTKIVCLSDFLYLPALAEEVRQRVLEVMQILQDEGVSVSTEAFGYVEQVLPVYYALSSCEASSTLSRFHGVIPGRNSEVCDQEVESLPGNEIRKRILAGTYILSNEKYREYFGQAGKIRKLLMQRMAELFGKYDFVLLPVAGNVAFSHPSTGDPLSLLEEDRFTVLANLTGLPAISIPAGRSSNGVPFGIQLLGPAFCENNLLQASGIFQAAAARHFDMNENKIL